MQPGIPATFVTTADLHVAGPTGPQRERESGRPSGHAKLAKLVTPKVYSPPSGTLIYLFYLQLNT